MKRLLIILQISFILILPLNSFGSIGNDATSFNPLPISVEAKASSGVPIGTVIAWPVSINPPDIDAWLDCKGQSISSSTYPELYAIVGSRIPNYQGMFLRGHGSQSHYKNNGSTVGRSSTYHASGSLGQVQGDGIRNITGITGSSTRWSQPEDVSGVFDYETTTIWQPDSGDCFPHRISFDASRVVPTANENRPVNKAVRYLIRAK